MIRPSGTPIFHLTKLDDTPCERDEKRKEEADGAGGALRLVSSRLGTDGKMKYKCLKILVCIMAEGGRQWSEQSVL